MLPTSQPRWGRLRWRKRDGEYPVGTRGDMGTLRNDTLAATTGGRAAEAMAEGGRKRNGKWENRALAGTYLGKATQRQRGSSANRHE